MLGEGAKEIRGGRFYHAPEADIVPATIRFFMPLCIGQRFPCLGPKGASFQNDLSSIIDGAGPFPAIPAHIEEAEGTGTVGKLINWGQVTDTGFARVATFRVKTPPKWKREGLRAAGCKFPLIFGGKVTPEHLAKFPRFWLS